MSKPKTILVDFDGTLHSYMAPWQGVHIIPDPPIPGAFQWLAELVKHFDVAIYSSRSQDQEGIQAMQAWFARHGLPHSVLRRLRFPQRKPPAHLTIDDRAYCFQGPGTYPTMDQLKSFKPWNK